MFYKRWNISSFLFSSRYFYLLKKNNLEYDMGKANAEGDITNIDKDKIEYPDLYIPLMSFISYILLVAFNSAYSIGKE